MAFINKHTISKNEIPRIKEFDIKPSLLIVEDNDDLRNYLQQSLALYFVVNTASDGVYGYEKANDLLPDIIVSDIMMPRMTGYEVCETLRKTHSTKELPIVFVTAKHIESTLDECMNCGGNKVLAKPLHKRDLLDTLNELVI